MKRGGYIERRTPMARSSMKRRPARRIEAREADRPFLEFVRTLPCCSCNAPAPSEASHVTLGPNEKGMGMKVPDDQAVPHCRSCHRDWEQRRGRFAGWERDRRWAKAAEWVTRIVGLFRPARESEAA